MKRWVWLPLLVCLVCLGTGAGCSEGDVDAVNVFMQEFARGFEEGLRMQQSGQMSPWSTQDFAMAPVGDAGEDYGAEMEE